MRLLTVDEAAERLGLKPARVYDLSRSGILPAVRLGGYVRFRPEAIESYRPPEPRPAACPEKKSPNRRIGCN